LRKISLGVISFLERVRVDSRLVGLLWKNVE
jgi:hypothetical protein